MAAPVTFPGRPARVPHHRRLQRHRRGGRPAPRPRARSLAGARRPPRGAPARARRAARRGRVPARSRRTSRDADAPARVLAHSRAPHQARPARQQRRRRPGGRSSPTAATRTCSRTMELNFDAQVRLTEELLPLLRASAPSAIVNVCLDGGAGRPRRRGRLQRLEVRARRLVRCAVGRGARQRRPRRAGAAGLHRDRGLPRGRAARQAAHPLDRLHAREGGGGDLRGGHLPRPEALRAARLCDRRPRCACSRPALTRLVLGGRSAAVMTTATGADCSARSNGSGDADAGLRRARRGAQPARRRTPARSSRARPASSAGA